MGPSLEGLRRAAGERRAIAAVRRGSACLVLASALAAPAEARTPVPPGPLSGSSVDTLRGGPGRPTDLSFHPDLLARLQVLAEALRHEIVLCLHGQVHGGTAYLTDLTMPVPRRSDAEGASFEACPRDALAVWHNHPVPPDGVRAPRAVLPNGAAGLCRLSPTDVQTAARAGHSFTVVSVDATTTCWWTLREVHAQSGRQASRSRLSAVY